MRGFLIVVTLLLSACGNGSTNVPLPSYLEPVITPPGASPEPTGPPEVVLCASFRDLSGKCRTKPFTMGALEI